LYLHYLIIEVIGKQAVEKQVNETNTWGAATDMAKELAHDKSTVVEGMKETLPEALQHRKLDPLIETAYKRAKSSLHKKHFNDQSSKATEEFVRNIGQLKKM
jgi:hypothetical protein